MTMNKFQKCINITFTYIGNALETIGKLSILAIYKTAVWVEKKLRPHV